MDRSLSSSLPGALIMTSVLTEKITLVWLFLAVLTGLSWLLADGLEPTNPAGFTYVAVGLFALAFFKVRLVIMYFMEVLDAPWILRGLFEVWTVGVFVAVVSFYLYGTQI